MDEFQELTPDEMQELMDAEAERANRRKSKRVVLALFIVAALCWAAVVARAEAPTTWRTVSAWTARECDGVTCWQVTYEWRERSDQPRRHYLYRAGVQVGGWNYDACEWRPYDAATGRWGDPQPKPPFEVHGVGIPPTQAPDAIPVVGDPPPATNYGIDLLEMRREGPRYERNGRPVTREKAFEAFGEALPDDSDAIRVTYIGPDAERVKQQIQGVAEFRGKVLVQCYASAENPMLRGKGFPTGLSIQAPDGRRLGAAEQWTDEDLVEGLRLADRRRRDPDWRPQTWPPLRDSPRPLDGLRDLGQVTGWAKRNWLAIAVAVGGAYLLMRRSK